MNLDLHSKARNYFEHDQEFDIQHVKILEAYEHAARKAAIYARDAIKSKDLENLATARHWESVTQTLEKVLGVLQLGSSVLELPKPFE
jgi:membrane-associated PAP2 superfamily phosphatase